MNQLRLFQLSPLTLLRRLGWFVITASLVVWAGATAARPIAEYPRIQGGEWIRSANLTDPEGNFQARQEHAALEHNGLIYLINGFVPVVPEPEPTENNPEPDRFEPRNEVMVYRPSTTAVGEGTWQHLSEASWFPEPTHHHIIFASHQDRIWSFGGHEEVFEPTDVVYAFTPNGPNSPEGTWNALRVEDGQPCNMETETCLRLPEPRAAGFAVSYDDGIFVLGGVVPNENARDPINQPIQATNSVLYLNPNQLPLTWQTAPPMNQPREHFTAVVVDGRIYAIRGRNADSPRLRSVESWAPGETRWRPEPDAPFGGSAGVVGAIGQCIYSFGGEFIATTDTGTLDASQVFHVPSRSWRILEPTIQEEPLDASKATFKHGVFGVPYTEAGTQHLMAAGGGDAAWIAAISRVHIFTPPADCSAR